MPGDLIEASVMEARFPEGELTTRRRGEVSISATSGVVKLDVEIYRTNELIRLYRENNNEIRH